MTDPVPSGPDEHAEAAALIRDRLHDKYGPPRQAETLRPGWEAITSEGRLVYYRRQMPGREWLAVKYEPENRIWRWSHYNGAVYTGDPNAPHPVRRMGHGDTAAEAMQQADIVTEDEPQP